MRTKYLPFFLGCVMVLQFAMEVHATEKLKGAFGVTFGSIVDPSTSIGKGKLTDGTPMYQFSPEKKFRSFDKYYVMLTPATNKVYAIWGMGTVENTSTCKKEQDLIMSILEDKYGKQDDQGLMATLSDFKLISQGNRKVMVKCSGITDVSIEIRYTDSDLEKLAEAERIKLESKKVDSSGL